MRYGVWWVLCSHAHDSFEFRKRSQLFIRTHNEAMKAGREPSNTPFAVLDGFLFVRAVA
jgi:hypothetical protein